jgi:hypothetical protein
MESTTMETTPADKVREYVQAHRNRELVRTRNGTEARSKPLAQIAEELGLSPAAVREGMRACGWFMAIAAAENADREAVAATPASAPKKKRPREHSKFNPHGWTE